MKKHKEYLVSMEIAGRFAMFTRPDSGSAPVSYPVPTRSAAQGIFDSVQRFRNARIRPTKVEICSPIRYMAWTRNYSGPFTLKGGTEQTRSQILTDVCYRLYGKAVQTGPTIDGINARHYLSHRFNRFIKQRRSARYPCLGWKSFGCHYFGPFREGITVQTDIDMTIPSLLDEIWRNDEFNPVFKQNVIIKNGVLDYDQ